MSNEQNVEKQIQFFSIGWGLGGGFGGIQNYEVIKARSQEEANKEAYERACEEYENHAGSNGLRTMEEIREEDEFEDDDEVEQAYNEDRESWLDYTVNLYTKELAEKAERYHFHNPFKEQTDV